MSDFQFPECLARRGGAIRPAAAAGYLYFTAIQLWDQRTACRHLRFHRRWVYYKPGNSPQTRTILSSVGILQNSESPAAPTISSSVGILQTIEPPADTDYFIVGKLIC